MTNKDLESLMQRLQAYHTEVRGIRAQFEREPELIPGLIDNLMAAEKELRIASSKLSKHVTK